MNNKYPQPIVVISRCLGFDSCRWDGTIVSYDHIKTLRRYVKFIPVCPELEIGLGVPREPIYIIERNGQQQLIQPTTDKKLTRKMNTFANNYLKSLDHIDGFILKSRSPSCGIKDTKIFPDINAEKPLYKNTGIFASKVKQLFPYLAIEDEKRLGYPKIKAQFLTKLFTLAAFCLVKKSHSTNKLINFHTQNRLLLASYNQRELNTLDKLVFNGNVIHKTLFPIYEEILFSLLQRNPKNVDALKLAAKLKIKDLSTQTYFHAYPKELMTNDD